MKTENFSLASATAVQIFHTLTRVVRYDEGSGTGTPLIRVRSLNTGELDVEMKPGRQIILPKTVDGIIVTNLTANPITGKLTIGAGDVSDNSLVGTVTLDSATLAALESLDLNAATINALIRLPLPGSYWANQTNNLAANTPLTVFDAASNPNGALVHRAQVQDSTNTASLITVGVFIMKATAPANIGDGNIAAQWEPKVISGNVVSYCLDKAFRVPAGVGLYWIQSSAGAVAANVLRSASYTLL